MRSEAEQFRGDPVLLSPAAELFAAFLERREAGERPDLDALCAEHPDHASKLRTLHANWQLLSNALEDEVDFERDRVDAASQARAELATLRREADGSGRLTVRGEVAHGGRGRILAVWDRDLRRELAMKVVLDSGGAHSLATRDPRALARFLEEAQVTGQLEHPGIVPVHELGIDAEGRVFYTMPLIRGESFERVVERVRSGEWSRARALGVLQRVCEAVAYAHSRGVVHRDLKPSNVMVGPFGETYVIDWGLAFVDRARPGGGDRGSTAPGGDARPTPTVSSTRRERAVDSPLLTGAGDVVGTPAYMAPEQARGGSAAVGPAVDVYAIGGMLYQLLAGRPPFGEPTSTPEQIVEELLQRPPAPLARVARDVPPELVAICERAMARDPRERYPSVAELADDLRAFLELRVVRAYRSGPWAELVQWIRRNRAFAAATAAAAGAVLVGLLVSLRLFVVADARGDDVLRLSALRDVEILRTEADALWPPVPALEDRFVDWIERARALVAERPEHRARRARLRAEAGVDADAPRWGDAADRSAWWDDQLTLLVDRLDALETGLLGDDVAGDFGWSVPRRLAFARALRERTVDGPDARARWARAAADAAARYDGLALAPQVGLLPLGPDPETGLLEFWHVASGSEPVRGDDGRLVYAEDAGVVLVLLPGGDFWMGAQSTDPDGVNHDPEALPTELPPDRVTLAPFFVAKHETTQAQWLALYADNPSGFAIGMGGGGIEATGRWPVENLSWPDADGWARRLGLVLPTEAQWEFAARAGASTPFASGAGVASLQPYANLADEGSVEKWNAGWAHIAGYVDGHSVTGAVGSLAPNAFGLFDLQGNVWEWTRDAPARYDKYPAAPGDGARRSALERGTAVYRGGSYYTLAHTARSAYRGYGALASIMDDSGFRAARALDPPPAAGQDGGR